MKDYSPAQTRQLIRQRRSIFPATYIDKSIPEDILLDILENANWAPNHKHTEPWRFKVFRGQALHRLGDYLAQYYRDHTPEAQFREKKYEKNRRKPVQSACVIAICMQRDPQERVPEWEELAAVSCAVQNMWLSCTAYGIGCYWSTPAAMLEADDFLGLTEGERCLGLFYMGYHELPELPAKRGDITQKITWVDQ